MNIIDKIEKEQMRSEELPEFTSGDTVAVHLYIKEAGKTRVQVFEGTVISIKGSGVHKTFTVRRISFGVGMERTLPMNSPNIKKVVVKRRGKTRRSKLYYLRGLSSKKARLKEKLD